MARDHIRDSIVKMGPPPADLNGPGAFDELRSKLSYDGSASRIAPLCVDTLDLPPPGFLPVSLGAAGGTAGEMIEKRLIDKMLPDAEGLARLREAGLARPYLDPVLHSRTVYIQFLRRLHACNAITQSFQKLHVRSFKSAVCGRKVRQSGSHAKEMGVRIVAGCWRRAERPLIRVMQASIRIHRESRAWRPARARLGAW